MPHPPDLKVKAQSDHWCQLQGRNSISFALARGVEVDAERQGCRTGSLPFLYRLMRWSTSGPCDPGNPPAGKKEGRGSDSLYRMDQTAMIAPKG
jgi:hypothetical protein